MVRVYVEDASDGVRVRVRDTLVTTASAADGQLQLERLFDVRRFRSGTDEPRSQQLVRFDVDNVQE